MKRNIIFLVIFLFVNVFSIKAQNDIDFDKVKFRIKQSSNSYNILGFIFFENGKIDSCGNGTTVLIIEPSYNLNKDFFTLYFSRVYVINIFDENKKYMRFSFPERYRVNISINELRKIIDSLHKKCDIIIDSSQTYPTTCQGIVIDNLNVREKPSLTGKKIGKLKKRDEITLYEQSNSIDEIDGEKNPWYKVKVTENEYGWVYGGYVRIFFEDENLGYSDKEKILESLN